VTQHFGYPCSDLRKGPNPWKSKESAVQVEPPRVGVKVGLVPGKTRQKDRTKNDGEINQSKKERSLSLLLRSFTEEGGPRYVNGACRSSRFGGKKKGVKAPVDRCGSAKKKKRGQICVGTRTNHRWGNAREEFCVQPRWHIRDAPLFYW